jgi:cell division protein FtsI/penicillin-binding protein 2
MHPIRKKKKLFEDWRTDSVVLGLTFFFLLIILRLFQIQVLDHDKYLALAQDQYQTSKEVPAKRGEIMTSDGYVLAGTRNHYLMFGEPKKIKDPYQAASDLSDIFVRLRTPTDASDDEKNSTKKRYFDSIYNALTMDLVWVSLERDVTPVEREELLAKNIEGIGFEDFPVRYYPEGNLASHVLGFVASNEGGEKTGYYGIEGSLNDDLKGKPGKLVEETDAVGMPILMGSYKEIEPTQGRDVVLTINRAIQYIAEKKIKDGVERYDAISGSIIIMDPFTGDVLAMSNYPTYSPFDFSATKEQDAQTRRKPIERKNLAISEIYEPGSAMKPFTIASAVDLKLITPESTFVDEGPVWYSGYKIDSWDGRHYGVQTIVQLLQKSNNIGAAWVGIQIGRDGLYKYLSNFGIGSKTNIDLEGEEAGILRDGKDWTDIDIANISFGQGVSTTPLQLLNGFNALINGGYLLQPRIILKMVDDKGETDIPVKSIRKVISKETSETMIPLLEKAVEGGESKYFNLKDYRIAGKTGTAQIPEGGSYSADRTNATFVGFMSGSKSFSMIIKLEQPRTSTYAAETAVPLWMETAKELAKFFGLPPDKVLVAAE